ncbi:hypothetical protein SDC9_204302 [bioreactor metagenome]|uniref:Uncharacterized protein n=1 Tax=bioreactor metagenome TaxID=1076179 RepID=A0A645J0I9_9ZZZZ
MRLCDIKCKCTQGGIHRQARDACVEVHIAVLHASIACEGIVYTVVERAVTYFGPFSE